MANEFFGKDTLVPLTDKKTKTTYWINDDKLKAEVTSVLKGTPTVMISAVVNRFSLFFFGNLFDYRRIYSYLALDGLVSWVCCNLWYYLGSFSGCGLEG